MAVKLPPQPVGMPPGHSMWNDWYEKLRTAFNSGQVTTTWANIDFTASDITDIVNRSHEVLTGLQGGTAGEHYHLTNAQLSGLGTVLSAIGDLTDGGDSSAHFHSADRARANHTGTQTMSTISDLPTLASGTYTPTVTDVANITDTTTFLCYYLRIGSIVHVSGRIEVNPTTGSTATSFYITLPIASNFSAVEQAAGGMHSADGQHAMIEADAANNAALFQYDCDSGAANTEFSFNFSYRII